jgi:hypothetical protein
MPCQKSVSGVSKMVSESMSATPSDDKRSIDTTYYVGESCRAPSVKMHLQKDGTRARTNATSNGVHVPMDCGALATPCQCARSQNTLRAAPGCLVLQNTAQQTNAQLLSSHFPARTGSRTCPKANAATATIINMQPCFKLSKHFTFFESACADRADATASARGEEDRSLDGTDHIRVPS